MKATLPHVTCRGLLRVNKVYGTYPIEMEMGAGIFRPGASSLVTWSTRSAVHITNGSGAVGGVVTDYEVRLFGNVRLDAGGGDIEKILERTTATAPLVVTLQGSSDARQRYEVITDGQTWRVGDTITWNTTEVSLRADPAYPWPVGKPVTDSLNVTVSIP
ncbi:TPA: hypothetical protein JGA48_004717 [Salmonella enterica]|nr:hypothetical protein [Salmonella enterica]